MTNKAKPRNEFLRIKKGPYKEIFFWFDKPYKKLSQSRRKNRVIAWDIEEEKRVVFRYNDWEANHKKAFNTQEASRILNRHFTKLYKWIRTGKIPSPYYLPPTTKSEGLRNGSRYLWQEKDFRNAVEYMESVGTWVDKTPTWDEVSAHINEDEVIRFIQDDNGNFIPLWRAD